MKYTLGVRVLSTFDAIENERHFILMSPQGVIITYRMSKKRKQKKPTKEDETKRENSRSLCVSVYLRTSML